MNSRTRVALFIGIALLLTPSSAARAAKNAQVESGHMRWQDHDAVLSNGVAWQEERNGEWVTVVLLTDKAVPRGVIAAGKPAAEIMQEAKTQGISFVVAAGGIPLQDSAVDVAYRDGDEINTATLSGAGGFEITSADAARVKGRALLNPFTASSRDANAWLVTFDAPVLNGDAKKMKATVTPLPAGGGQPGTDLLALLAARRAKDYNALLPYSPPDVVALLKDSAQRDANLKMFASMTPPQAKILGGWQKGDEARLYWRQQWPAGIDSLCIEQMKLVSGKWQSIESACQSE